ncbi:divalent-cation tolerance protein CutA [Kitasatospora cheerisanensis]|uniref:Divalent cation transporter n=1 Tax=Kitasatospora cheerisanensis KCTC 2395 TaxID=1348663 RepID=A0A066YVR8_9ACTN|nr:divalent-cation tolerance protein CutA [Kitasatospora cheerisanensis]KDN82035.1 divalent cation transporter [Kitasatospora cheerisanensis KCTC 2395]
MTEPQHQHLVVTTTHEDEEAARALATTLVRERLAACAQLHPVRSVYWWDGEVQDAAEWRIDLKTGAALVPQLVRRIVELHPYDTPEVIAVPITAGAPGYLAWLDAETAAPGPGRAGQAGSAGQVR